MKMNIKQSTGDLKFPIETMSSTLYSFSMSYLKFTHCILFYFFPLRNMVQRFHLSFFSLVGVKVKYSLVCNKKKVSFLSYLKFQSFIYQNKCVHVWKWNRFVAIWAFIRSKQQSFCSINNRTLIKIHVQKI